MHRIGWHSSELHWRRLVGYDRIRLDSVVLDSVLGGNGLGRIGLNCIGRHRIVLHWASDFIGLHAVEMALCCIGLHCVEMGWKSFSESSWSVVGLHIFF